MKLPDKISRIIHELVPLQIPIYSGNASFFLLLSFFPLAILLLALLQYLPVTQTDLLSLIELIVPQALLPFFSDLIQSLTPVHTATVIPVSAIAALWSASRGLHSLMNGLNTVEQARETRSYLHRRALCAFYTLLMVVALLLTLLLHVFGQQLLALTSIGSSSLHIIVSTLLKNLHLYSFVLLSALFTVLYLVLPNRRTRTVLVMPGAAAAAMAWMIFSTAFSYYVSHIKDYSAIYGSLTTVILTMLWLYFCISILFYGAYLNRLLFRHKAV